jgi:CBS domain-containing protein
VRARDAMSTDLLVVGAVDTVAGAARLMLKRRVGAAVVMNEGIPGPGIITERDVMRAVADGRDPKATPVEACMTFEARTATTNWDLATAAEEMINGHSATSSLSTRRDVWSTWCRCATSWVRTFVPRTSVPRHASEAPAAVAT